MAGQAAFDSIFGKAVTSYVPDKEKVDSDETKNDEKMKVKLCNLNGLDVTEEEESAAELKPEPESLWNILQESTKAATVFEAPGSSQSVPEPAAGHVPDQEEDPRAGIPPFHLTTNEDFAKEDNAIKGDPVTGPLALTGAVQVAAIKDQETFKALEDVANKDLANKRKADGPADEAPAEDQPQQEQAEPVPDQEEDPRAGMPPVHLTTSTFARRKRPKTAEVAQLRWDVLRAAFVHEIKPLLTSPSAHEDC